MSKYIDKSKEELIEIIESLDNELSGKKYGLIWDKEKEPELVVEECAYKLPVLKRVNEKEITSDDGIDNILIEGDNYHTLTTLCYTHEEKIDVIYIDPPYNTGNKDFIYNDKFVDVEDGYRHSKWLNFMEKRLKLARNLLKEEGVMFISIDDNEYAQLKMLCSRIFGESNIETMIWHKVDNDSGKLKITYRFRVEHEYILVVYKNKQNTRKFNKYLQPRNYKNQYTNPDNDPRGAYKQGIISDTEEKSSKNSENYYSVTTPGGRIVTRRWRVPQNEFNDLLSDNRIYFGKDGNSIPSLKVFINEPGETTPVSILENLGTAKTAGITLIDVFGGEKVFSYPKPVELIKHLIQISSTKDSIILDFFAGSGTTGHAVIELNSEDEGKRQFILCTNNENNICENVTYPRIKNVINGYKDYKGLGGNLKYFKKDFVEYHGNADQLKFDLTDKCTEMLCVKESTFNLIEEKDEYKIFANNDKTKFTYIYYELYSDVFNDFKEKIKEMPGEKKVYIFTLNNTIAGNDFENECKCTVEPIPYKILEIYKRIVNDNRKEK